MTSLSVPPRIVSVFGASGLQGSSVVEALLRDGTFTPRALTRSPTSEAGLKLQERGVEVVAADSSSKESLVEALRGSEAVFAVTVPTIVPAFADGPDELTQGRNMVDAAREAGVKFFIFSSLPNMTQLSGGKYSNLTHYDDKAAIQEYLQSSGLTNASLLLGGFADSLWTKNYLQKSPTSPGYTISVPKYTPTALEAHTWVSHDVGEAALALLKNYDNPNLPSSISGKSYPVVTANLSYTDLAERIEKALGVPISVTFPSTSGNAVRDAMLASHAEYNGLYTSTPVPNPELVELGARLGTVDELVEEVRKFYANKG
ncbi:hypothetical protein FB45DRAFT_899778 [Roridomyces roridus]|uniref:NmrA-like domain-containing protein n=1 Tax=Roridomyces roridus TaxID=1738132 RepID=A0AAD7FVB5_9AGAR|nr:hypothetical protein FB45DRAFT_899778 [Roridomyces roridus]